VVLYTDWQRMDQFAEDDIFCRCGMSYHSHAKAVMQDGHMVVITRKPCPVCGKSVGNARRVSHPTEYMTLRREDEEHHDHTDPD
jgi:hypothetical protein